MRHRAQTGLRLFGEPGENHGDVVAGMLVPRAGNHHARAIDLSVTPRRLQRQSHLCPRRKAGHTSKLNAILVNDNRVRRQR